MPTAPTLVAFANAEASGSPPSVTTASLSWQTNDVVVVFTGTAGTEPVGNPESLGTPTTTGTGISFGAAQQIHNANGADCSGGGWAAVATASSSGTFSATVTATPNVERLVIGVFIHRGSAGIGNSNLYVGASPTGLSLTPTGADGTIDWIVLDWAAATAQTMSPTPTTHGTSTPGPQALPVGVQVTSLYTYNIGDLDDQTSAGATSYGIAGAGTGPFTILAIEAKATGGTDATVIPPARTDVLIH